MKKIFILLIILGGFGFLVWSLQGSQIMQVVTSNEPIQTVQGIEDADIYQVDTNSSQLSWLGQNSLTNKQHYGIVNIKSGYLAVKEQRVVGGEFIIDMTTIADQDLSGNSQQKINKHLSSNDFFAVEQYPESFLIITGVELIDGQWLVSANLTIKGVTKNISFPAQLVFINDQLTADSNFGIDRTQWGIEYGSSNFFSNLGDKAIDNEIGFTVSLQAYLSSTQPKK